MLRARSRATGRHRAAPSTRSGRSDLFLAGIVASVLAAVVAGLSFAIPKLFHHARSSSAAQTSTTSRPASTTPSATSTDKVPQTASSNACTYEILAIVDSRVHNVSTDSIITPGTEIEVLATALQRNFTALMQAKSPDAAVQDTITMARQICGDSGDPMLTEAALTGLKGIAPKADTDLLNTIVEFAPAASGSSAATPAATPAPTAS